MANLSALVRTTPLILTNSSGSAAPYGSTVILKRLTDKAFNVAPSASYAGHSIGVILEPLGIANGQKGLVAFGGYVPQVNLDSAGSQGQLLFASGTFFKSTGSDTMAAGAFGELISAGSAPEAYLFGFPVQSVGGGGGGSDLIRQPPTTTGQAIDAGFNNTVAVSASDAVSLGNNNATAQDKTIVVGIGNTVTDNAKNMAFGYKNTVGAAGSAPKNMGFGYFNVVGDSAGYGKNIGVGFQNISTGGFSIAMGYANEATSPFSTAMGRLCKTNTEGGGAAFGYKAHAYGAYSAAFGQLCTAQGDYSSAFGYHAQASNYTGPYATHTYSHKSSAFGFNAATLDTRAQAFGYHANAKAPDSTALGRSALVDSSGSSATAVGFQAVARIERTTNIAGPIIIRKDDGETSPFESFCGVEVVIFTNEVDLKSVADTSFALPAGCKLWLDEVGVICTALSGLVTQPVVRFGITGTPAKQHAAAITTKLTAAGKRDLFAALVPEDGESSFSAGVTVAANATTMLGRFYLKGLLVESE